MTIETKHTAEQAEQAVEAIARLIRVASVELKETRPDVTEQATAAIGRIRAVVASRSELLEALIQLVRGEPDRRDYEFAEDAIRKATGEAK